MHAESALLEPVAQVVKPTSAEAALVAAYESRGQESVESAERLADAACEGLNPTPVSPAAK